MKRLFLIRHAKSDWGNPMLLDMQRPLNARGHADAPRMASHLKTLGFIPDLIVSSPAVRARTTAEYFAKTMGIPPLSIDFQSDIYEANETDIMHIIHELPESASTVFLFGHNPTMTYVADSFAKKQRFDNIPTCGIVQIQSNTEGSSWATFNRKTADAVASFFPKNLP